MAPIVLSRPRDDRMIAGVCAMVARRFGWSSTWTRVLALFGLLFFGSTIPIYIAFWLIVPAE
ncbi:PspC domain-containing protein [Microbacterium halophytorum]|uniref:PspC domain-containing protein n=1 Tax=Microbacterium halophytorum TaxID=2067568 RepID=UPI000CFE0048|nr:PspC domain-containing protein [Microbacterium halophytorum]